MPEQVEGDPSDAPLGHPRAIWLRLLSEERARHVLSGESLTGDQWAPGYPAEGDLEASGALLRELARGGTPGPFGPYEVVAIEGGRTLGGIGFHSRPDEEGVVEIGYGIVETERNKGYATAALLALLEVARAHEVRAVTARALPTNQASRRVMEKAGMSFVGLGDGYACYRVAWRGG